MDMFTSTPSVEPPYQYAWTATSSLYVRILSDVKTRVGSTPAEALVTFKTAPLTAYGLPTLATTLSFNLA